MKRIRFRTGLLLVLAILAVTATSVFASVETTRSHPAEFMAGAASFDITPPIGTPLGGTGGFPRRYKYLIDWFGKHPYANFFTPSQGVHDPLRSKALILKNSKSAILFLSLDLVGVTSELYEKLNSDLKRSAEFDEVIISATHTHSGSGALSTSWLWEILAMDQFNQTVYDDFIAGVKKSIELARERLEPAVLASASFDVEEIHRNRRGRDGHMDNRANLLLAKTPDGTRAIGGIVNYAIHGMAMGGSGFLFSADVSGGIERHLEKLLAGPSGARLPTMLFVNGAEGDVTTSFGGSAGVEKSGAIFASKAAPVISNLKPIEPDWRIRKLAVKMPKARLNLGVCGTQVGKKPLNVNLFIGKKAAPRVATVWQIEIGDIGIFTFPGEPTTDIGEAAKATARAQGVKDPWIFGLTNGHMAYFVTPEEYREGGVEGCSALHGPQAASLLLNAHESLLKSKR